MSTDDHNADDAWNSAEPGAVPPEGQPGQVREPGQDESHPAPEDATEPEPAFAGEPAADSAFAAGIEAPGIPGEVPAAPETAPRDTDAGDVPAPAEESYEAPALAEESYESPAPGEESYEAPAPAAGPTFHPTPDQVPVPEPLAPASEVLDVPAAPEVVPRWEAPGETSTYARPAAPADTGAVAYPAAAFIPPPAAYGQPSASEGAQSSAPADGRNPDSVAPSAPAAPEAGFPPAAAVALATAGAERPAGVAPSAGPASDAPSAGPAATYPAPNFTPPVAIAVPILTAPKRRSNRRFGILVSLLSALVFAVVYAAVGAAILAFSVPSGRLFSVVGQFAASPAFYVPVIFFALAMILTVVIVNRAGWWAYVLGGFLIAAIVYGAAILGALIVVQAWTLPAADVGTFIRSLVMDPLTLAAALVAREVPIWAGAWIASRGRKLKAKNVAAREEHEQKLAQTPVAQYPTGEQQPTV